MTNKLALFLLILVTVALGGCYGHQEIFMDKRKIVYVHGGLLSFGALIIRDLEIETKEPPPAPAVGAGALGN